VPKQRAKTQVSSQMPWLTNPQIADLIRENVQGRELQCKKDNRYREVLHRLLAWDAEVASYRPATDMDEGDVRMPADMNLIDKAKRYTEAASCRPAADKERASFPYRHDGLRHDRRVLLGKAISQRLKANR